ncbi:MAG: ABC transporter permease, partial [Thermomicrobiales bacterium]
MPAHISAPDPESIPSHNRHRRSPPTRRPRQPSLPIAIWIAAGTLALFVLIPLAALLLRAAGHSGSATDETWRTLRQALRLTAITSCLSLLLVTALGTPLAFILARRRFRGSRLLDALIDLPMILPPAVAGIALLMAFGRRGLVGEPLDRIGITVGFSGVAVVIAQTFVSAPFYVRTARAGFARIDAALEESAADLGASPGAV